MNFESGSEQRNSALDALKQRQKVSQTMPTLTGQQANILYTMPLQTVERLEQVLRSTLALQETIRAGWILWLPKRVWNRWPRRSI